MDERRKEELPRPPEGGRGAHDVQPAAGPNRRWSARRKAEVVLRLLRGEPLDALSREIGVEVYRLEEWRSRALSGVEAALKERGEDPLTAEHAAAMKRIGELTMENEILRARCEKPGPFGRRRSRI
jgi:transposase-like protein